MTKEDAEALAIKRNANKGKSMSHMEWQVVEDGDGWKVQLLETTKHKLAKAHSEGVNAYRDARQALLNNDMDAFFNASDRILKANLDSIILDYEAKNPPLEQE